MLLLVVLLAAHVCATTTAPSHAWAILASPHTAAIAAWLADGLTARGVPSIAVVDEASLPPGFDHYVVVLPTARSRWPASPFSVYNVKPGGAFALSDTETAIVASAANVLDASSDSLRSIVRAVAIDANKAVFLPVGNSEPPPSVASAKMHDVVVVAGDDGDGNACPVRRLYVEALTRHSNLLRVATVDTYTNALQLLASTHALVVIPCAAVDATTHVAVLHAALLARVRVVTLASPALAKDYPHTYAAVHTVPKRPSRDRVQRMMDWIAAARHQPRASNTRAHLEARSAYMLSRFLVGVGIVPPDVDDSLPYVDEAAINEHALPTFVLAVPELARRDTFVKRYGSSFPYVLYDGYMFKQTPFMGCGLSYQRLARLALARGWDRVLVMEDDVVLPPKFTHSLTTILNTADADPEWDLFSGMISDVHNDTRVLKVLVHDDHVLATVDRLTSTVFNVYRTRALQTLASWNATNADFYTNTVDRYMQASGLRALVRVPYLVGHDSGTASSIWALPNSHYDDVIADSVRKLQRKARAAFDRAVGNDLADQSSSKQDVQRARRRRGGGRTGG